MKYNISESDLARTLLELTIGGAVDFADYRNEGDGRLDKASKAVLRKIARSGDPGEWRVKKDYTPPKGRMTKRVKSVRQEAD